MGEIKGLCLILAASGSLIAANKEGERGQPWRVPRWMKIELFWRSVNRLRYFLSERYKHMLVPVLSFKGAICKKIYGLIKFKFKTKKLTELTELTS